MNESNPNFIQFHRQCATRSDDERILQRGKYVRVTRVRAYVSARGATDGRTDGTIDLDFYAGNKIDQSAWELIEFLSFRSVSVEVELRSRGARWR